MYIKNILQYLENTAERHPHRTAFFDEDTKLDFFTLSEYSRAVGSALSEIAGRNQPVMIFMNKHPFAICACLGVVYSGNFYVCADTRAPLTRIRDIMSKTSCRTVIYDRENVEKVKMLDGRKILFDDVKSVSVNEDALFKIRKSQIDTDPLYIVFTSGSTGEPKGVVACHRSVIDYTEALCSSLGFSHDCVFGNQSPLYFDAPIKEIMPTLKLGCSMCFIPEKLFMFPYELCDFLNKHKINTLCWVSSAFSLVSSLGALEENPPKYIKKICFGSELFPMSQYKKWRNAYPYAEFYNLYGPTEATGMSCFWHASRELCDGERIPIGRPFDNTDILLHDGEIYIRGTCVTLGYYNAPELTNTAFVQNPTHASYTDIVYKTGDMGKINEYGELVFLGRRDCRVKRMGRFIELAEIESAALLIEGVRLCAAVFFNEKIYLFYAGDAERGDISAHLKEKLPRYMLPDKYKKIACMPKTASGKIDRASLAEVLKNKGEKNNG